MAVNIALIRDDEPISRWRDPDSGAEYSRRVPIVLLPGINAPAPVRHANVPDLLAEREVIVLDTLGQPGTSVQTEPISSSADQADWVDQALEGLGHDRVHPLGFSLGGWNAVNLARHHPERVAGVSVLDPVYALAPARPSTTPSPPRAWVTRGRGCGAPPSPWSNGSPVCRPDGRDRSPTT